jgi:nucleotide-binding universal stress UspA family protein
MSPDIPPPVVVGVDESQTSLRAARFGAEEARQRNAPLRIVHAISWPLDRTTIPGIDLDLHDQLRVGEATVAQLAVEAIAGMLPDERISTVVEDGPPVDVLEAASADAQLVVVGSRGIGGVAGLLVGSTASGLVAHAHCPVIVLHDDRAVRVSERRSVVVGVQGSQDDEQVLAFAFGEAAARHTDLVAVHAWQVVVLETSLRSLGPLVDWAGVAAEEGRLLGETLSGWRDKEPDVPVREVVMRDRPAVALVAAATTAQLLVVGHRRRKRLGSTTHAVLHRTPCPVAVVPLKGDDRR